MHVVLVGPELEENLSLRYLAAALRAAGHTASLARFDSAEHTAAVVQQVRREQPELVGLSMVFQWRGREFCELARALRQAAYPGHITAGGHFATFAYEPLLRDLPELDSVVRQEGEVTIVELAAALQRGAGCEELAAIPGMVVRGGRGEPAVAPPRQQVDDLDTLPFPARDTPPELHLGVPTAYLAGSRGCYAACDYCCIFAWHEAARGRRYRVRSAENVAEEMALLYHERGVRNFVFHDDNFFLPTAAASRRRFEALRAAVQRRHLDGIGLVLKLRPNDCDRENLLILKDIGLFRVFVGIENASGRQLRSLGRKAAPERLASCLHLLRDLDVYCTYNIILFDPYTTLDDVATNLRFLREHPSHPFNWCKAEVYAGTELERRYGEEGRLRGDHLGRGYDIEDPRARLMYDLLLPAVYGRNYDFGGLANLNIGLGYNRHLLKHFHPGQWSPELHARVGRTIEAVNANAGDLLARAHSFSSEVDLGDRAAVERFGAQLQRDARRAEEALGRQVEAAFCELDALAGGTARSPVRSPEALVPAANPRPLVGHLWPRRGLVAALASGLLGLLTGCTHRRPRPPVAEMAPAPLNRPGNTKATRPSAPEMAPPPLDKSGKTKAPPAVYDPPARPLDRGRSGGPGR